MKNSDKNRYIPLEVDEQAIDDLGLKREDIKKMKIGCRMVDAIMVPCTEQEYKSFMRGEWNEEQREFRSRKCAVPSEKTGKLVRCTKSCKACERMKSGAALSLEAFEDEFGYEPEGLNKQVTRECDTVLTLMLIDDLIAKLRAQSPELATIFEGMLNGASQREIERELGVAHGTMTDMVKRMRSVLQQFVSRNDILG